MKDFLHIEEKELNFDSLVDWNLSLLNLEFKDCLRDLTEHRRSNLTTTQMVWISRRLHVDRYEMYNSKTVFLINLN